MVGVLITHYADDVDIIATLLEKEFLIDEENSIDKRQILDPDRFGYLSLHYVASFNTTRLALIEYKVFENIKFEIQIRSILQHTWAEIEHDIGYKSKAEVPRKIRRQFSRLAGLLEIADNEFVNIKHSLDSYEEYIKNKISISPEKINIDKISLYNFINTNELVKETDNNVVRILEAQLIDVNKNGLTRHIMMIEYFNIDTIFELNQLLLQNKQNILKATTLLMETKPAPATIGLGISIRLLIYVIASKTLTTDEYKEFVQIARLSSNFDDYLEELHFIIK